ncbi:TPA: hypothetical protein N0F65_009521 [Lagenidium giganteum]|uniref:Uncharacterized protein n=1 Tax=Lagenidium giganteum TaxID=4803 RepID=A0AAV2YS64_9STRA|nr:TPA: hypothetical protein N0F65_009521 [Lagenidium giganteum]
MSICSQYAVMRLKFFGFFGSPFTTISPMIRPPVLRPAITSINVVLPAPVAPINATMRPGSKWAVTPRKSCFSSPDGKVT